MRPSHGHSSLTLNEMNSKRVSEIQPTQTSPVKTRVLFELFLPLVFAIVVVYIAIVAHSLSKGSMHKLDFQGFMAKFTEATQLPDIPVPNIKQKITN